MYKTGGKKVPSPFQGSKQSLVDFQGLMKGSNQWFNLFRNQQLSSESMEGAASYQIVILQVSIKCDKLSKWYRRSKMKFNATPQTIIYKTVFAHLHELACMMIHNTSKHATILSGSLWSESRRWAYKKIREE